MLSRSHLDNNQLTVEDYGRLTNEAGNKGSHSSNEGVDRFVERNKTINELTLVLIE